MAKRENKISAHGNLSLEHSTRRLKLRRRQLICLHWQSVSFCRNAKWKRFVHPDRVGNIETRRILVYDSDISPQDLFPRFVRLISIYPVKLCFQKLFNSDISYVLIECMGLSLFDRHHPRYVYFLSSSKIASRAHIFLPSTLMFPLIVCVRVFAKFQLVVYNLNASLACSVSELLCLSHRKKYGVKRSNMFMGVVQDTISTALPCQIVSSKTLLRHHQLWFDLNLQMGLSLPIQATSSIRKLFSVVQEYFS